MYLNINIPVFVSLSLVLHHMIYNGTITQIIKFYLYISVILLEFVYRYTSEHIQLCKSRVM